jgi:hypothetical protein
MTDKQQAVAVTNEASKFGLGRLKPGSVVVTVGNQINHQTLHEIIDTLLGEHGCLTCGLGGLDIIIRHQDPRILDAFHQIPAVRDVTVVR